MKKARVFVNGVLAGHFESFGSDQYRFSYEKNYQGQPISLTMPIQKNIYEFNQFPPFFEGLLPEGIQLEALLRQSKLDRNDFFAQLVQVGADLVGAVTVEEEA